MMKRFILFLSVFFFSVSMFGATTWTGNVSNDWFTPGNWDNGLPGPGNDATIPQIPLGPNFPSINNQLVIQNYTIDNRGIFEVSTNGGVSSTGHFINRSTGVMNISMVSSTFTNGAGGLFENFGTMASSGSFSNSGGTFTNHANAAFANFGNFFNSGASNFSNLGFFLQFGTYSNMATVANAGVWDNFGLVNNNGTLVNGGTGAINVMAGSELRNNAGLLTNGSSNLNIRAGAVMNNFSNTFVTQNSTVTIDAGGTWNNSTFIQNDAQITNNGLVNNFFCATIINNVTLTNFSTINNQGFIWNYGVISPNQPNNINNGTTITPGNASGLCVNISRALDGVGTPIVVNVAELVNPMMPFCGGYSFNVGGSNSIVFDCSNFGVNMVTVTINGPQGFSINCTAEVTITDPHPAQPACKPAVINIPNGGIATVTPIDIFAGGFDNCGIINLVSVTPNQFFCAQLGTHTVTLNVNDGHGNMSSCDAQVTIVDATPPSVTCKNANVILDDNGMGSIMPSDVVASAMDNCGIQSTVLSQYDFACMHVGPNTVTVTVFDHSGLMAMCDATVTVIDDMTPVIGCQPQLQGVAEEGLCGANLHPDPPLILMENCGIASITSNSPGFFPVGTTIVTWTVVDNSGNTATCTQEVVVWDNQAPSITCNSVVREVYDNCIVPGNIVNLFPPFTDDNCGIDHVSNDAPPVFMPGNHVVVWTAWDVNGNYAQCEQWVKIMDNIDPEIENCPEDIYVDTNGSNADVSWTPPTASDNCGVQEFTSTANPGDNFELGEHEVTYTAYDGSGNKVECTFTITVGDGAAPIISGGPDAMYALLDNCDDEAIFEWEEPTITDGGSFNAWIEDEWAPGDDFPVGTTTVTYVAEDASGNQSTYSFDITVETNVEVSCPQDIYVSGAANIAWNEMLPETLCEDCPNGELEGYRLLGWHNGHQYYISDAWESWEDAQLNAEALGGHLAVINDEAENFFVSSFLGQHNPSAWIGLQTNGSESFWVNEEAADYQNWLGGAPSEDEDKNFGLFQNNGLWTNENGELANAAIIEFPCFSIEQIGETQNGEHNGEGEYIVTYDVTDMCGYNCECSFNVNVVPEGEVVDYCSTVGIGGPSISSVKIGTQAHTSGDDNGYGDFTDFTFVLQEQECVIELIPTGNEADDMLYWRVWVDLNQDGDFYDQEDLLLQKAGQGTISTVHKFTLPIPTDGTRMRITCSENGFAEVCGDFHDGEVEDYTILFEESDDDGGEFWDGNTGNNDRELTLYPNPANSFIYVNTLSFEGMQTTVKVFNALGQQMHTFNSKSMDVNYKLDLSDYNEGVYTIVIDAEGKERQSKTFVVSK